MATNNIALNRAAFFVMFVLLSPFGMFTAMIDLHSKMLEKQMEQAQAFPKELLPPGCSFPHQFYVPIGSTKLKGSFNEQIENYKQSLCEQVMWMERVQRFVQDLTPPGSPFPIYLHLEDNEELKQMC